METHEQIKYTLIRQLMRSCLIRVYFYLQLCKIVTPGYNELILTLLNICKYLFLQWVNCNLELFIPLQGMWFGLLHHVTDEHVWALDSGANITQCSHGPLTGDRPLQWISKGSPPHNALRTPIRGFLTRFLTISMQGKGSYMYVYFG